MIKSQTRSSHSHKVSSSLETLKKADVHDDEYAKVAIEELESLQKDMKQSKDFAYLNSLKTYQAQQIALRQQYWTNFSDIDTLISVLKIQLERYCQNDPATTKQLSACAS